MKFNKLKTLISSLLTCVISTTAYAGEGDFTVFINGGYNLIYQDLSISQFHKDYATVWGAGLKEGFHSTGIPFRYQFGASYWFLDKAGFYISTTYAQQSFTAEFNNGDKRIMQMKSKGLFNFGINLGNPDKIYFGLGCGVGTSLFNSSLVYKDGTTSYNYGYQYNYESAINGIYSDFGFSYEGNVYVHVFKGLHAMAGISGIIGSGYTDKNFIKGIDRNAPYETVFFPSDYITFVNATSNGTSYDYPTSKIAKAATFNAYIGLQYNIKLFKL
ncbi:MAG: hypothetical protein NT150_05160 [Bacteroidetes bacterium]|nr:hypothetical protein [Bacteroidota bacterium]